MRFLDAVLVLALAARIHRTDRAVREVARAIVKRVDPRYRHIVEAYVRAKTPCAAVEQMVATLPDWILQMNPDPRPVASAAVATAPDGGFPRKFLTAGVAK